MAVPDHPHPLYESRVFTVQDSMGNGKSLGINDDVEETKCDSGRVHRLMNVLLGIAVIILLFVVVALTVALLTASSSHVCSNELDGFSEEPGEVTGPTSEGMDGGSTTHANSEEPVVSSREPEEVTSHGTITDEDITDCYDLWEQGRTASGAYTITPPGWNGETFTVNCNMSADGGGWTIIQRRMFIPPRESFEFDQDWDAFMYGFGNLSSGYWLGNEKVAFLTNSKRYELRIDLVNELLNDYYAKYDFFRISEESDNYRMVGLGNYTGTAGNDMEALRNVPFSAYDRDNAGHQSRNCADYNDGGWWYDSRCSIWAWLNEGHKSKIGYWKNLWEDPDLVYSEMKIKPVP